jgi:hypothetical protein
MVIAGLGFGSAAGREAVAETMGEAAAAASSLNLRGGGGGTTIDRISGAGRCTGVSRAVPMTTANPIHSTALLFLEFGSPSL